MIGRRISHYRITERIGAGGMGEVYRARDEHLPRDVAIKILPAGTLADDLARRRFRKEAETLSQLNHPHIATIYDFDTQDDVDFLVMEYVEGTTLAERLAAGPLSVDETLRIGSEIAEALDEARHRGIVHRDLKPKNIGLTLKGEVKVLDFGLAKVLRPSTETTTTESMAESPALVGTLPYMAPELLRGAPADHRSDLYALGVCLYEMSTGKRPFEQELASALIGDILHASPSPPRHRNTQVPKALEHVILNCLEKDPARRYRSAHHLGLDLERAGSDAFGFLLQRNLARHWPVIVAVTLGMLLLALVGFDVAGVRTRILGRAQLRPIASILALPSEVLASDEDERFFADAIPRTLSTYLTQIEDLETKLPPTSFEVERIGGDVDKIAKAYGVGALVLSTVTVQSDNLMLSLQLVDAGTRRLLWSHEYDGTRQEFLNLVRSAAEGLRGSIRPGTQPVQTVLENSEAEILFQRGMYYLSRYNNLGESSDFERGLDVFQQALALDPKRADAAAAIGTLYSFRQQFGFPHPLPNIEAWARKALEIDPRNGRACGLTALRYLNEENPLAALSLMLRGTSLAPRDAWLHNNLGNALAWRSMHLALQAYLAGSRLDPLYQAPSWHAAHYSGLLRSPEQGLAILDRLLDFEPDMPVALWFKALQLVLLGRSEEASTLASRLEPMVTAGRFDSPRVHQLRELILVQSGNETEWRAAMNRLLVLEGKMLHEHKELLAMLLAARGETAAALEVLEHMAAHGPFLLYDWLMLYPPFRVLRGDPRFDRITEAAKPDFEELLTTLDAARAQGEFPAYLETPLADLRSEFGLPHPR